MNNYSPKNFEEIFRNVLDDMLERGMISHAEDFDSIIANQEDISNYYVMDKAAISLMFERAYEDATKI